MALVASHLAEATEIERIEHGHEEEDNQTSKSETAQSDSEARQDAVGGS
jgi:hypothetical protein